MTRANTLAYVVLNVHSRENRSPSVPPILQETKVH